MSERTLDSNLKAAAESAVFNYVIFVKLAFPSGTLYAHNGVGTKSFGGDDYLGVGAFGGIDGSIEDTLDLQSRPVNLILSSITSEIITAITTDDVFGRDADIYLGALNAEGELQGTPDNWYSGHMEQVEVLLGKQDAVKIRLQSRASRLQQRNNKRYVIEDHQLEFSGDMLFEFLPFLQEAQVVWGGEKVRTGFTNTQTLDPNDGTRQSGITRGFNGVR